MMELNVMQIKKTVQYKSAYVKVYILICCLNTNIGILEFNHSSFLKIYL